MARHGYGCLVVSQPAGLGVRGGSGDLGSAILVAGEADHAAVSRQYPPFGEAAREWRWCIHTWYEKRFEHKVAIFGEKRLYIVRIQGEPLQQLVTSRQENSPSSKGVTR